MINTPAAKLESEPCRANPIARPAAAITAANEVVFTPRRSSEAMTTKAKITA